MGGGLTEGDQEGGAEKHDWCSGVGGPFEVAGVADYTAMMRQRQRDLDEVVRCLPSDDGIHYCSAKAV